MNNKPTLHFFCGKMAAGKSTLAKTLAKKHNAVLLVEDEWLSELYPEEITNIPDYLEYSSRLKNVLSNHIKPYQINTILWRIGSTRFPGKYLISTYLVSFIIRRNKIISYTSLCR